jgi:hypothetical protein
MDVGLERPDDRLESLHQARVPGMALSVASVAVSGPCPARRSRSQAGRRRAAVATRSLRTTTLDLKAAQ